MAGITMRKRILRAFIKWLEENGVFEFDIGEFSSRLRLQKYVFIARFFGLDLGYGFGLYLRGPYSPDLSRDYYELAEEEVAPASLPGTFRREDFLKLVKGKEEWWLEIAATILLLWEEGWRKRDEVIEAVARIKSIESKEEREYIADVLRDLVRHGIVELEL